jgi:hypothetical protein
VVESFEADTHGPRSSAEANQADALNDAVARLGHDGKPNHNQGCRFDCFSPCSTISAGCDGPFGYDTIDIFRDPPTNLFDWTDPRDDFATDEREPFDCFARVGQFRSRRRLWIKELGRA